MNRLPTTTVRRSGLLVAVLLVALAAPLGAVSAAATPPDPPAAYYGQATVNGQPAPAGVTVTAWVDGDPRARLTTGADGAFGGAGAFDEKLAVQAASGADVRFTVGGVGADTTVEWQSGDHRELALAVADDAAPTAVAAVSGDPVAGAPVTLSATDSSDNGQIVSYEWSFDDGGSAAGARVSRAFSEGRHEATLTVTDMAGHTDSATVAFTVAADSGDGSDGTDGAPSIDPTDDEPTDSRSGEGGQPSTGGVSITPAGDSVQVALTDAAPGEVTSVQFDGVDSPALSAAGTALRGLSVSVTEQTDLALDARVVSTPPAESGPAGAGTVGYIVVDHDAPDSAIGDVSFDFAVEKDRLAERNLAPSTVTLYRYHDGEWTALDTERVGETADAYRYRAESPGLSVFAIRAEERAPAFSVTEVGLDATRVTAGDSVSVSATVSNDGTGDGEYAADLVVDGETVETKTVSVAAGESATVTFTVSFDEAGTYDVRVGDHDAGTVEVRSQQTSTADEPGNEDVATTSPPVEEPSGFDLTTIGIVAALLLALLALFVMARRTA